MMTSLLDVLVAERGADVLVADLLAILLEGHAPGLQRFHERHAVAKLLAADAPETAAYEMGYFFPGIERFNPGPATS